MVLVEVVQNWIIEIPNPKFEVKMKLAGVYRMSENDIVEFLIEGNMV